MELRDIKRSELTMMRDFLYHAIYTGEDAAPLPRSIIRHPDVFAYIDGFGSRIGDRCIVADIDGAPVGAVWTRLFSGENRGYGNVDSATPELSMSVLPEYRGRGIGKLLLAEMLERLKKEGCKNVSLSVQKENFAMKMYEKAGFHIHREEGSDAVMVWHCHK